MHLSKATFMFVYLKLQKGLGQWYYEKCLSFYFFIHSQKKVRSIENWIIFQLKIQ